VYYQDASCRLETFREFEYEAISIQTEGTTSQGKTGPRSTAWKGLCLSLCALASRLCADFGSDFLWTFFGRW